jgi:thiol-disulfide isomerase/thioredoxin
MIMARPEACLHALARILAMRACMAMMRAMTQVAVPQNQTSGKTAVAAQTFLAVVKRECETCVMAMPVLRQIEQQTERVGGTLDIHVQDDPDFAAGFANAHDDTELAASYRYGIDTVPTLIRLVDGREDKRVVGWRREEWQAITGIAALGEDLPAFRPGCGSMTMDPGMPARLKVRYGNTGLASRRIEVPALSDAVETCYERGWSDGMPVVPPTEERVLEMLDGTPRSPREVIGMVPPNLAECTVEKIAINAVMAGCRPEYMPVVLTAIEAALMPGFGLHGVLATTNACTPVVMVNGPIARAIGMNSKGNVFGQGNRANAAIGRTLQLVVRNVGGGRPGEIDRSVFGSPAKYSFCFAEDEDDPRWESFAVSLGYSPRQSTVTIFPGDGITQTIDHISRTPEDLCRSYAPCLRAIYHPGHIIGVQAFLAIGGEHQNVFYDAGWSKARVKEELLRLLMIPVREIVPGRSGLSGLTEAEKAEPDNLVPKFKNGTFNIIRAGGKAGKYSAIISSIGGRGSIEPVTKEIK